MFRLGKHEVYVNGGFTRPGRDLRKEMCEISRLLYGVLVALTLTRGGKRRVTVTKTCRYTLALSCLKPLYAEQSAASRLPEADASMYSEH